MVGHVVEHDFGGRTGGAVVVGDHVVEFGFGHGQPAPEVIVIEDEEVAEEVS